MNKPLTAAFKMFETDQDIDVFLKTLQALIDRRDTETMQLVYTAQQLIDKYAENDTHSLIMFLIFDALWGYKNPNLIMQNIEPAGIEQPYHIRFEL